MLLEVYTGNGGKTSDLNVDVVEGAGRNSASAVTFFSGIIVLFDCHLATRDLGNPRNMAIPSSVALGDASGDRGFVDLHTSSLRSFVPAVCVAPVGTLVLVVELDAETVVDAPSDEARTLALVVIPLVNAAALALVRVVILHRAGDGATRGLAGALGCYIAVLAGLDVVVSDVTTVGGLVPNAVAEDGGALCLASDFDISAFLVGLL